MQGRRLQPIGAANPKPERVESNGHHPPVTPQRLKFREQAEIRISKALDALDYLADLARLRHRSEYEYRQGDADQVESHIMDAARKVVAAWRADPKGPRIKLDD